MLSPAPNDGQDDCCIVLDSSPEESHTCDSEVNHVHRHYIIHQSGYTMKESDSGWHTMNPADVDPNNGTGHGNVGGGINNDQGGGGGVGASDGQGNTEGHGSDGNADQDAGAAGNGGTGGGNGYNQNGGNNEGDNNNEDDDEGDDDEEEEEDDIVAEQEGGNDVPVSTGSSSGPSSLPPLVRPPSFDTDLDIVPQHESEALERSNEELLSPRSEPHASVIVSSESTGGGLSDAPTAVLGSDPSNGDNQPDDPTEDVVCIDPPTVGSPQPGPSGLNVTVSSLTSSSSSGQSHPSRIVRKRTGQTKGLGGSKPKRAKHDISSSTDTSGRDTSTTTTATTTTTTASDTPGDTPGDSSRDTSHNRPPDASHDAPPDSTNDPSVGHDDQRETSHDVDRAPGAMDYGNKSSGVVRDRCRNIDEAVSASSRLWLQDNDASQNKASLLLSQASDIELSLSCIPPSQDEYPCIPRIMPTSPTNIAGLLDTTDCSQMALRMSPSQFTEYSCDMSTAANHSAYHPFLAGSQSDSIDMNDDGCSLTSRPAACDQSGSGPTVDAEATVHVDGDLTTNNTSAKMPTFHWEWQQPALLSEGFENSSEGINAVFKKTSDNTKLSDCPPPMATVQNLESASCDMDSLDRLDRCEPVTLAVNDPKPVLKTYSRNHSRNTGALTTKKTNKKPVKIGAKTKKEQTKGVSSCRRRKAKNEPTAMDSLVEDSQNSFTHLKESIAQNSSGTPVCILMSNDDGSQGTLNYNMSLEATKNVLPHSSDKSVRNIGNMDNSCQKTNSMQAVPVGDVMQAATSDPLLSTRHPQSHQQSTKKHQQTPASIVPGSGLAQRRFLFKNSQGQRSSVRKSAARISSSQPVGILSANTPTLASRKSVGVPKQSSSSSSAPKTSERMCTTLKIESVIRRTIFIVEETVGGKVINRKVIEETKKIKEDDFEFFEGDCSPVSSARSRHSLSSGDLADISSISSLLQQHRAQIPTPDSGECLNHTATTEPTLLVRQPLLGIPSSDGISGAVQQFGGVASAGTSNSTSSNTAVAVPPQLENVVHCASTSRRVSDVLFSSLEARSDSDGKRRSMCQSYKQLSNSSLFSTDTANTSNGRPDEHSITGTKSALSRCDTLVLDQHKSPPDDHVFRLPLPCAMSDFQKRHSTGSSASRRSSSGLSKENCLLSDSVHGSTPKSPSTSPGSLNQDRSPPGQSSNRKSPRKSGSPDKTKSSLDAQDSATVKSVRALASQCQAVISCKGEALDSTSSPSFDLVNQGEAVLAQWQDKYFYPATVLSSSASKVEVRFGDGKEAVVKPNKLVHCGVIPSGLTVLADRGGSGCFEPAIVQSYYSDGTSEEGYHVIFKLSDPEAEARVPKSKISLNKSQMDDLQQFLKSSQMSTDNRKKTYPLSSANPTSVTGDASGGSLELKSAQKSARKVSVGGVSQYCPQFAPRAASESTHLLCAGQEVYALWKDNFYYPGTIKVGSSSANDECLCTVLYDDGNELSVTISSVIICDLLPVDTQVVAQRPNSRKWSEPAIVVSHYKSADEAGYIVEFQSDQHQCRVKREDVALDCQQAVNMFKENMATPAAVPDSSAANLVQGKRKRIPLTPGRMPATFTDLTPDIHRVKQTRMPTSSGSPRRKAKSRVKPPAGGGTPVPGTISDLGSPTAKRQQFLDESVLESPQHVRNVSDNAAVVPDGCSNLFTGISFLVTHVEKPANSTFLDTPIGSLASSEDIPFDKNQICQLIETHGGVVLETFDPKQIRNAELCLLVSDCYQRTRKYLCALAAGIPCISHVWIHQCCGSGVMLDYKQYFLPAGFSLEMNRVVERGAAGSVLMNWLVVLASDNDNFKQVWLEVLETAGCSVLSRLPAQSSRIRRAGHKPVDVVVADKYINTDVLHEAEQQGIPVVSCEWVIQCLIAGKRPSYTGHPKYRYNAE